ncbi:hypothetical protein G7054_g11952 [Neopestalotiopsis clavispora]|nr:hypothetical protein G7054_g11952 [Neopestalotiopsis clavispora]
MSASLTSSVWTIQRIMQWSDEISSSDFSVATTAATTSSVGSTKDSESTAPGTPPPQQPAKEAAAPAAKTPDDKANDKTNKQQEEAVHSHRRRGQTVIGNAAGMSYRACHECGAYDHQQRDCAARAARIARERHARTVAWLQSGLPGSGTVCISEPASRFHHKSAGFPKPPPRAQDRRGGFHANNEGHLDNKENLPSQKSDQQQSRHPNTYFNRSKPVAGLAAVQIETQCSNRGTGAGGGECKRWK